jgi:hypothetical protein
MKRSFLYRVHFDQHRYYAVGATNVHQAIQTARAVAERHYALPPGSKPMKVERIEGADSKLIKRLPRS